MSIVPAGVGEPRSTSGADGRFLRLLGVPRYAHVPLVIGADGRRLAKRHGAVTLADRKALGEGPREALAWMAVSLGLAEPGERPTPADLLSRFDPSRLPREPTVWDPGVV